MKKRIITAICATIFILPFLWFSGTFMLVILACLLSLIAEYEILGCIGVRKKYVVAVPSYVISILLPVGVRALDNSDLYFRYVFFVIFTYIFYLLTAAVFSWHGLTIDEAVTCAVFTVYITFAISSIILLRDLKHGVYIYLLSLVVPWINDSFAYFFGCAFGRHKLIPEVSPKKTVEGAVAGVLFGCLSMVIYGFVIGKIFDVTPRFIPTIIVGIVVSVLSQCGDLVFSKIKRRYNIKDFGIILPGHGGVLDRIDSVIAVAPFLYIICSLSEFFELFF
ncbi:MAG: phosphatidate cytidylyltransferase [Firmicutes bacterium]|nr:phosphatidate cytidylyltransferase [Bacillota bacterium]